ncbi:MAG: radical SAM protein [Sphingobacteriaceae bacterium]|nr:MAG: radical SAM protein [Sphingobacteriaceae bacterium]
MPKRVVITPDALKEPYGQEMYERINNQGLSVEILKNNRITGLRGATERETYKIAKNTLAIVNAPPSSFNLRPIPPSADWQFHLAEGCPAHCQYCYLAGSLSGPPAIRVFANLPSILDSLHRFERLNQPTSFEASCYTDPLSLEHLTGGLNKVIRFFGERENSNLRFVTKFDAIKPLLDIPHNGHTRFRISLNAEVVAKRLEGGTASVPARIKALRKLAQPKELGGGNYPIGVVLAPIMPIPDWEQHYTALFEQLSANLDFNCDLTFELISHRFTPGSKDVLMEWYPNTSLEMDEDSRTTKKNKFGGTKFVYTKEVMKELKSFFELQIKNRFPQASILYWT